jgi:hypothetical protein
MLSSPTNVYDSNVPSATVQYLTHYRTALEFCQRDARYSLTLPGGAALDPARSGVNKIFLM